MRWGRFSLWVDTASNRFELNGQSLFGWVGRRDPLESLRGLPLDLPGGTEPNLAAFLRNRARAPLLSGLGGGLALAMGGGLALAARGGTSGLGMLLFGAAWVLLGAGLRGAAGLAHGGASLVLLALAGVAPWLVGLAALALLFAQGLRVRRAAAPLLAVWALAPGSPLFLVAWVALAVVAGLLALRPRNLVLPLSGEESWRFHCQVQSVLGLDDATLWSLRPFDMTGLPPDPGSHETSLWRLNGGTPVIGLGDELQKWILLPQAILVIQEGIVGRLHGWSELRMEGRPCTWEARPPELPESAWTVRLSLAGEVLVLLFGDGEVGRAFQDQWATWAPAAAEVPAPPLPSPRRNRCCRPWPCSGSRFLPPGPRSAPPSVGKCGAAIRTITPGPAPPSARPWRPGCRP